LKGIFGGGFMHAMLRSMGCVVALAAAQGAKVE
jgi:hypothetical protein